MTYDVPKMEVVEFGANADVVTTSGENNPWDTDVVFPTK